MIGLPLFFIIQTIQWLGLLLDEILFPRYRRVAITEPMFIVGVARSRTTLLHRTLARDCERFTNLRTWELLFALSITARRFWRALAWADASLGGPLRWLLNHAEHRLSRSMSDIHEVSLTAREEDYLALLPIMACFLLVLPFPRARHIWRLVRFDEALPEADKRRIIDFYKLCLRKHLYVHGEDKSLLSKNPSFSSWVRALQEAFPDSRIVCCVRDPKRPYPRCYRRLNRVSHYSACMTIERRYTAACMTCCSITIITC